MSTYLQGLKDGELMYEGQIAIGRTIDQLQAVNIVKMFRKFNTTEKPNYWLGYLDALQHHVSLNERGLSICEIESEQEAA